MADGNTNNKDLILLSNGSASGTWGTILNNQVFTIIDQALGNTASIAVAGSDVNLTTSQVQNLAFNVTGVLSGAISITLPLNPNSTTQAVGGFFVFDQEATGNFAVTVKTIASGSTGVQIPYGRRSLVYSDGTNVTFADDTQNQTQVFNGNPNGSVSGQAGSTSTRASKVIDYSTNQEYLCTTTGTAGSAGWSINFPFTMPAQGFLTASSNLSDPSPAVDVLGATTIYYTGMVGSLVWVYNGVSFTPVQIPLSGGYPQMTLNLSGSAQASNGIYDVLFFLNSGSATIGFSPAWPSATPGSCSRGSGPGSPQLWRSPGGILINAVAQTVNNGSNTYSVAASRGTYLGSVWIDSTAGQVTCHRSYGQSRKFGIWNYYNRLPILLKAGDSTSSWAYNTAAYRPSNNNSANNLSVFTGMVEEEADLSFLQYVAVSVSGSSTWKAAISQNSTASASGTVSTNDTINNSSNSRMASAAYISPPALGINTYYSLEQGGGIATLTWNGTETNMQLIGRYRG